MFYEVSSLVLSAANVVVGTSLAIATFQYKKAAELQAKAGEKQAIASDLQAAATVQQAEAVAHRPYVYLELDWRADTLTLVNAGDRVAHNVELVPIADSGTDGKRLLSGARLAQAPCPGIAPGGRVRESRGNSIMRSAGRGDTITFEIRYKDAGGAGYEEQATYSLGETNWVGGSPPTGMSNRERSANQRHGELLAAIDRVATALPRPHDATQW